tara:strand:- start:22 stop:1554 length:1533 start_codon:yes stop_codon:yes gene_type:complete
MKAEHQQAILAAYRNALSAGDNELAAKFKAKIAKEVAGMSGLEQFGAGAAVGVDNLVRGTSQRVGEFLPEAVSESLGLKPKKGAVEIRRRSQDALMNTIPGMIGSVVPEMVATGPGVGMKAALKAGSLMGLLQPTNDNENPLVKSAIGAAGSALGEGATKILSAPFKSVLNQDQRILARKAEQLGIKLDPAQKSGNRALGYLDSALGDMPITSGGQKLKNETQYGQVNRAISRTFGADTDKLSNKLFKSHQKIIGDEMNEIASSYTLNMDRELMTGSNGLIEKMKQLQKRSVNQEKLKMIQGRVQELLETNENGKITGEVYRRFNTEIEDTIASLKRGNNGDAAFDLGQVKDIIDEGVSRSMDPADLARFNELRGLYSNLKTAEGSFKKTKGEVSLNKLRQLIDNGKGQEDLADIAKISDAFLRPPPNSGTAPRNEAIRWLANPLTAAGGYALDPTVGMGMGSGLVVSSALRNLMDPSTKTNALGRMVKSKYPSQLLSRGGSAGLLSSSE